LTIRASDEYSTDGKFVWISGEPVTYTNWQQGEPNNYWGNEDFGVINFHNWYWHLPIVGTWNDSNEEQSPYRGIVELKAEPAVQVTVDGGGSSPAPMALSISGGSCSFGVRKHLSALSIESGSVLLGNLCRVLAVDGLSIADGGILDLASGDLIVKTTSATHDAVLANVINWIRSAASANGSGIISSATMNDTSGARSLAVVDNDAGGAAVLAEFDGVPIGQYAVLVRYTYNGDANLDGIVNADDYFLIDSGFITQKKGWYNGDFNYDGAVNADDYFLIDCAFVGQSEPQAAKAAMEAATAPASELVPVRPQPRNDQTPTLLAELFSTQPIL